MNSITQLRLATYAACILVQRAIDKMGLEAVLEDLKYMSSVDAAKHFPADEVEAVWNDLLSMAEDIKYKERKEVHNETTS